MALKDLSDTELTELVRTNSDDSALEELIDRHSGIYIDSLKFYGGKSFNFNQLSDFLDLKDEIIYKAANRYDPSRAKFSTHLANTIKFMCLSEKSKFKKESIFSSLDSIEFCQADDTKTPDQLLEQKDAMKKILYLLKKHEDSRVYEIFVNRYFNGSGNKLMPWHQVGKKVNLTAQGCIDIHQKVMKTLKQKIHNENTVQF